MSNQNMMLQYGFAQMGNKADEARLGWGLTDAVGHVAAPKDYTPLLPRNPGDEKYQVYESTDPPAVNEWWSDERLALLEGEAFPAVDNSFMSSLKIGKKMN